MGYACPDSFHTFLRHLESQEASPRLRQKVYDTLRAALNEAVTQELISVNPALRVARPRAPTPEIVVPSDHDVEAILRAARDRGFVQSTMVATSVGTGVRQGELFGLQLRDVDFDAKTLTIARAVRDVNGTPSLAELKTKWVIIGSPWKRGAKCRSRGNLRRPRRFASWRV